MTGPGTGGLRPHLLVAAVAVVALVVALVLATAGNPPVRTVEVTSRGGLVLATGHGFPPSSTTMVSAETDGGSGSTWTTTTADGGFGVAFSPPAGFTGDVQVTALADGARTAATVEVGPTAAPTPDSSNGGPAPVPMTGAPAAATVVPATSGLPEYQAPASIPADCSVDVTEAMNAWLGSVPDGSQLHLSREGCYRVDGSLALDGRNDLVIEGNSATVRAGQEAPARANRAQWFLQYGSNITLRNMTLVGVNPQARFELDHEWDHNVFIRGTHTVTIQNVHGRNTYGDFIAIAQGADGTTIPSDITIRDVSADTVGRMGISCVACDGVSVSDSVFNDIAYHVFDLEIQGDDWPGRDVSYTGNTIGSHGWAFFSVGTPFQTYGNDLSNVRIAGNTMTMPGWDVENCVPAISFRSSKVHAHGVTITDNELVSHSDAVLVRSATGVTIRGNSAELVGPGCDDPIGIRTSGVEDLELGSNKVTGYPTQREIE